MNKEEQKQQIIDLMNMDAEIFAEGIKNHPALNEELKQAAKDYTMQKTVLQQLIEKINNELEEDWNSSEESSILNWVKHNAQELLEQERQHIQEAFCDGVNNAIFYICGYKIKSAEYYESKFKPE